MMTTDDTLSIYGAMAELTEQMLAAASKGEWDDLVVLEQRCASHARTLQQEAPQPMQGAQRERKVELIRRMLTADRQIRDLTMPWMAQLSALISNTRTQGRLLGAYGTV
jgi:flagellar protein FliT